MSNITLNIVEPGSGPAPLEPVVPSTGLFTHGIGGPEATIIAVSTILVLALVAAAIWYYKKHKNIHLPNITKHIKSKKSIAIGLTTLAILVSASTFTSLLINAGKSNTNAVEGEDDSSLTVDVSDEELTIEVGNEPVFAVLPVEVSVEEATQAGYTLTAYADSTDLISTTDPSNVIPMVTLPEPLVPNEEGVGRGWGPVTKLTDNTYGLALGEEPTSKDAEVYTSLSTDSLNPTIVKSMTEYTPTEENDTTTIYYGFYITPGTPYGTYTGSDIYYDATINTTLVTFDGKGLYFNDDEQQTINTVEYIAVSQENNGTETSSTINQPISGEYKTPSQSLPYRFLGWNTDPEATEPTYTSEDDIAEHLPISPNIPLTLYAVWQKATTITFDNNGGAGEMNKQTIIAGESANLYPNTFTKDGYTFNGWNTDAEGEGKSYADKELYQAEAESANVTLFAQWKKNILYMQKVSEWGSSLEIGDEVIAVDNRDDKEYYVARLKDGNIWMTQNLDHNIVSTPNFYTYENTDIGHGATPNPSATWTGTATRATSDTTWTSSTTTPESYDPGKFYWNGGLIYDEITCGEYGGAWDSTYKFCVGANVTLDVGNSHYHLGNYYNWTAAVAMSDSSTYTTDQTDVDQSICPAGWRLPTYSGNKSYYNLVAEAGLTNGPNGNIHTEPNYFVYGGHLGGFGSNLLGENGYYWSSVVGDDHGPAAAYSLSFSAKDNTSIRTQNVQARNYGCSLRCVVR